MLFGDVVPAADALTLGAPARLAPQASAYAASDTDEAGPAGPDPTEHEAALRAWGVAAVVCLGPNRCYLHLALRNRLEKKCTSLLSIIIMTKEVLQSSLFILTMIRMRLIRHRGHVDICS